MIKHKLKSNLEYFLRGWIDIYRIPTLARIEENLQEYGSSYSPFYLDPEEKNKDSETYWGIGVGCSSILTTLSSWSIILNQSESSITRIPAGICVLLNSLSLVYEAIRSFKEKENEREI